MKKLLTLLTLSTVSILGFSQINITQGLGAYYPFNGNANDSSGNGNDGTIVGVTPADDRKNNANSCYFFDGNDHYIGVPSSATVEPKNAVSVSMWLNTTDKDYWNFAICKRLNLAQEPGNSYFLGTTGAVMGGATWQWTISSATTQHYLVTNTLVEDSTWLHLVGTFDGDTLELFLNAQSIGTKIISHTDISYSNLTLRLGLGIPTSSGAKTAWKGYMDEVRIYDRQLTNDEVKYLYNPALLSNGKELAEKISVSIYPNPTNEKIFVTTPYALDVLAKSTITITDVLGKVVLTAPYSTDGIDVKALNTGTYFINVDAFNSTQRFIKN